MGQKLENALQGILGLKPARLTSLVPACVCMKWIIKALISTGRDGLTTLDLTILNKTSKMPDYIACATTIN
jgi:hypothetical protein